MWYGSDYEFGALAFQPRLYEWYFDNSWILPTNAFGAPEEQDWYRGIGVDANGDVWAAAHGWGLSHLSDVDLSKPHGTLETLNTPDLNMNALVVDMDNSIWIGADGGLFRYTPSTKTWTTYSEAGSGIAHVFLDDTVTPRAIYAATNGGIFVYRGP
jgi:ligand-binding sensor domain-containing protein